MSSPGASPAPTSPPAPPANATSPPPAAAAPPTPVTTPPPAASPPAPVVTPPPATSPPATVTPPPATSPPSPPSSTPSPPPASTTPSAPPPTSTSPPSPPSTTPSPPSGSTPSPPVGGNQPPASGRSPPPPRGGTPTPPSSNRPPSSPSSSGGGGGVSTTVVVGIAIAAVAFLVILSLIFIFCRKKKRRSHEPLDYYGPPPSGPKVDPHGGPVYQWQHNAPPPGDHVISMPPKINPPPGGASRPPHSPLHTPPPPPPGYISSSGSGSNYSGSEVPPPPSPGMAYGFSNSTFTYEELAMATDGFSNANLLGQGGFGYVHRGILPKDGKEVAVKQLKAGSGQGEREFQAEVEIISRVHHKHLVSLVGYCITGSKRLLVYEFVPNNTLEFHLHGKGRPPLDWSTRMKIALGSAKGLAYLHEDCHPKIFHRDIKAANILLDFNFEAKVADFGLAKFSSDANTHVSTRVMGTFGYLAPEYAASGKLTDKSDVFSFGVVLLELITGRRPVGDQSFDESLVDWARPLLTRALEDENFSALVDPRLQNDYNPNEMARMVACAAACVRHSSKRRPRLSQVVRALEGDVSLADLNEGIRPGHSSYYSSHGSSDYDTAQHKEDFKNHMRLALGSMEYGSSEYSGGQTTSEYGLNPSGSSSEAQTREMEMRKPRKDSSGFSGGYGY